MWFWIVAGIAVVIIIVCAKSKNANGGSVSSVSGSQASRKADRIYPAQLPGVKMPKISTTKEMLDNPVIQDAVKMFTMLIMKEIERQESVFWAQIEQKREYASICVSQKGTVNYMWIALHTPGDVPDVNICYSSHNMEEIKHCSVTKKITEAVIIGTSYELAKRIDFEKYLPYKDQYSSTSFSIGELHGKDNLFCDFSFFFYAHHHVPKELNKW